MRSPVNAVDYLMFSIWILSMHNSYMNWYASSSTCRYLGRSDERPNGVFYPSD